MGVDENFGYVFGFVKEHVPRRGPLMILETVITVLVLVL